MNERGHAASVRDVMTSPVATIGPDAGLKEAAARMRSAGITALPVVDATGRVIGVLSEADLLVKVERPAPAGTGSYARRQRGLRWSGSLAEHLMSRPPVTIAPDAGLAQAAGLMHRHGLGRLPVVDAGGRPVGIVSRGDLLTAFFRPDEEIRRDVEERLGARDLAGVTATVEDGVVTLRGIGPGPDGQRRMREVARGVAGVVGVRGVPGPQ